MDGMRVSLNCRASKAYKNEKTSNSRLIDVLLRALQVLRGRKKEYKMTMLKHTWMSQSTRKCSVCALDKMPLRSHSCYTTSDRLSEKLHSGQKGSSRWEVGSSNLCRGVLFKTRILILERG